MTLTASLIPALPVLWLALPGFWTIVLVQDASGFCCAGFSPGANNYLYDVAPVERRTAYSAIHNVASNAGIFGGALLGGYLAAFTPATFAVFGHSLCRSSGLGGYCCSLPSHVPALCLRCFRASRNHVRREISAPATCFCGYLICVT